MKLQALLVPVFDGENFDFWSIKMINLLQDARALFTIQQALTDEIFLTIYEATGTKQALDILRVEFRETQEVRSAKLRFYVEEFDRGVRMEGPETCQEYYSKLRLMVSRIRYYGGVVREEAVVRKLLEGLLEELEPIVSAMGVAGHLTISALELIGSLEASEMRLGLRGGRERGSEGK
ncbi:hypothetical protein NL676_023044 [Syzygium grande]|nr:hypothetical protein NL676_023044 [Syzygium grande]